MTAQGVRRLPEVARWAPERVLNSTPPWAFPVLLLSLVIEFARPQDLFRPLALVRPALLLSGALALVLCTNLGRVRWRSPLVMCWGALLLFMALWVPVATNNRWALNIFTTVLQWGLFALVAQLVVDTPRRLRVLLVTWALCGGFQALWAIGHGGGGTSAYFGDENDAALLLNVLFPFAIAGARAETTRLRRGMCAALTVLLVCGVAATGSRGGFLGLVAVGGAAVMLSPRRGRLLLLGAAGALLFALLIPDDYRKDLQSINDDSDGSRRDYYRMWDTAELIFNANPLFGVGQGNINWVFAQYERYDTAVEHSFGGRPVHSAYWTLLPELGLLGIGLYLALTVHAVRAGLRASLRAPGRRSWPLDPWGRALLQSLAPLLVSSGFISTLYYPQFYYLMAVALVLESQQQRLSRAHAMARRARLTALRAASAAPVLRRIGA